MLNEDNQETCFVCFQGKKPPPAEIEETEAPELCSDIKKQFKLQEEI